MKTQGKGVHLQAKGEASEETNPANTLISDFWPPEREEINFVVEATRSMVLCHGIPSKLKHIQVDYHFSRTDIQPV